MSIQVSPGLVNREIDLSLYLPALSTTNLALVGVTHKGDMDTVYEIESFAEYVEKLGIPTTPAGYVAQEYLKQGKLLKVVRVGGDDAEYASVDLDLYPTASTAEPVTGDDASDPFVGAVTHTPVCPGSFYAQCGEADSDISSFFIYDDGAGKLSAYHASYGIIGTGTIDYVTGAFSVSLSNPGWDFASSMIALYVYGSVGANDKVTITAKSKGTWGNNLSVKIRKLRENAYKGTGSDFLASAFSFEIYENDVLVETHRVDPVTGKDQISAETLVASVDSAFVTLEKNSSATADYVSLEAASLSGGDDGDTNLIPANVVGQIAGDTLTGMQLFSNPETVDVNLIAAPDFAAASTGPDDLESAEFAAIVAQALITLCESRGDCMALVDPPYGLDDEEVLAWHNGEAPFDGHSAFNSSYGALYWPFHTIYDSYTNGTVQVAPSGPASAIMAYTDYISEVWFAPAGLQRGKVSSQAIEMSPDLAIRETLLGTEGGVNQCVNPFVKLSGVGIVLWGQKTLQRTPTALDRVNVRRLLLYVEKLLATVGRVLLFEPNDEKTWRKFVLLAEEVCDPVKARRGLYDFRVICDSSTNTPEVIDQNRMVGKVLIKPTKTAEVIVVDWTLLSTGMQFTEFI